MPPASLLNAAQFSVMFLAMYCTTADYLRGPVPLLVLPGALLGQPVRSDHQVPCTHAVRGGGPVLVRTLRLLQACVQSQPGLEYARVCV